MTQESWFHSQMDAQLGIAIERHDGAAQRLTPISEHSQSHIEVFQLPTDMGSNSEETFGWMVAISTGSGLTSSAGC